MVKGKENINKLSEEIQFLRNEVVRVNNLYASCCEESIALKQELRKLEVSFIPFIKSEKCQKQKSSVLS